MRELLLLLVFLSAWSAEGLTLRSSYPVALRPGFPVLLSLTLSRSDALLVSGRLRLVVSDGRDERLRWTSEPWTLSRERTSTVVLPVIPGDALGQPRLTADFIHDNGAVDDLGELQVLPQANHVVMLYGGVVLGRTLAPERLVPGEGPWRTAMLPVMADAVPGTVLGWSAADVVAMDAAALTALTAGPADGLRRWIRAGGALVVAGTLPAEWTGVAADAGLGVVRATGSASDERRWRNLVAEAWGMDAQRRQDFVAGNAEWLSEDPQQPRPRSQLRSEEIVSALWPTSLGRVPVGPVLGIFGLFVLIVGPGEWFLLGLIRRRRWTWITFPLTAAAATWATLAVAQHALGASDHHRRMRLIDANATGEVWRTAEYDLRILGAGRLLSETPGDALWQPLPARAPRRMNRGQDDEGNQVAWEGGTVERQVSQWSPVLSVQVTSQLGMANQSTKRISYEAQRGNWAEAARVGGNPSAPWVPNDNHQNCGQRAIPLPGPPEHPDEIAGIHGLIRPPAGRHDRPGRLELSFTQDADGLIIIRRWTFAETAGF